MSKAWAGGTGGQWRKTRLMVLNRDNWRCQLQLDGCQGRANTVHHTKPRRIVGDNPAHLVAACGHCNYTTGDPTRHDPPISRRTQW